MKQVCVLLMFISGCVSAPTKMPESDNFQMRLAEAKAVVSEPLQYELTPPVKHDLMEIRPGVFELTILSDKAQIVVLSFPAVQKQVRLFHKQVSALAAASYDNVGSLMLNVNQAPIVVEIE